MRIALAGAGAFGIKHLDALDLIDGVTVTSVVSRRLEQAEEVAQKYGAGHASTDLGEALARDDVDAVILCTPDPAARRQAIAAMRAGKHVQVEIPLADSWADAEAVDRVQRETGLVCMVGHTRRFNPSHQWIHQPHRRRRAVDPADGRADLLLPPHQHERARPARAAGPTTCCGTTPRTPSTCSSTRPARTSRSPTPCRARSTPSSASRWTCRSSCGRAQGRSARCR